jgi:hypothetical protein
MYKGMNSLARYLLVCLLGLAVAPAAVAQIYKVVNPDGSVTYTDQRPSADAEPLDLPPLSVVETDIDTSAVTAGESDATKEPTLRELRRQYRDFRIMQPQNEETFWGTGNQVTVSWGASEPIPAGFEVFLFVNGGRIDTQGGSSVTLTLDRGTHQVYAELRDDRKRVIKKTDTVTFYIKQYSQNFNQPRPTPRGG